MLPDFLLSQSNLVVFVSVLSAAILVGWFQSGRFPLGRTTDTIDLRPDTDTLVFRFDGDVLHSASGQGREMLSAVTIDGSDLDCLWAAFGGAGSGLQDKMDALLTTGQPFVDIINRQGEHPQEIRGTAVGALVELRIRPAGAGTYALQQTEEQLAIVEAERDLFSQMIDRLPVEVYSADNDGRLTYANSAYRERFLDGRALSPGEDRVPEQVIPDVADGEAADMPVEHRDGEETVLRVHSFRQAKAGGRFGICQDVTELHKVRQSLNSMMATLADTFAHLSVGLAVFNEASQLTLFNPALVEMLSLNPAELAKRPALRQFLEALRSQRMVPEQQDFGSWRRQITRLEAGARDGQYLEDWQLPSGQILRVTGKPHAQGGIALLFEDISNSISLERRYRNEIGISQATLDHITDAVAVFNLSGALVFANTAFDDLWGVTTMDEHPGPTILQMIQHWRGLCRPTPTLGELHEFVTSADNRAAWQSDLVLRDGRVLHGHFAPLPDGSALVVFTEKPMLPVLASAGGSDSTLGSLPADVLSELLTGPMEDAIVCLETCASRPDDLLTVPAQRVARSLRDGRTQATRLLEVVSQQHQTLRQPSDDPFRLEGLRALVEERGLSLDASGLTPLPDNLETDRRIHQKLIWSLGLAATEQAPKATTISLSHTAGEAERMIEATLSNPAKADGHVHSPGLAQNVLQRLVEDQGGSVQIAVRDDVKLLHIVCRLPAVRGATVEQTSENVHLRIASSNG